MNRADWTSTIRRVADDADTCRIGRIGLILNDHRVFLQANYGKI